MARVHGSVLRYLTYLSAGQPVNALGAIRVVVGEDVVREILLFMKTESRSAELDVVVDELICRMIGDALRGDLASCFETSLDFHGVGDGQAGQCRWDEYGEETHDYYCTAENEWIRSNDLGFL
jgi:hypothetical protein